MSRCWFEQGRLLGEIKTNPRHGPPIILLNALEYSDKLLAILSVSDIEVF